MYTAFNKKIGAIGVALMVALSPPMLHASDALYIGKNMTNDGGVLLAGFGDEPSSHWLALYPRKNHESGETVSVGGTAQANLPGELINIPQVPLTYRYLSMDYSFFLGLPAPLTNGGMNEFGLAVRDVALFSRTELVKMTPNPQHGLNYSDIARIVLERARTAREAVQVATALIDKYGYFTYGGNSHVFADPNEGWVLLEMAGGKGLWVARRLGPNDVWMNWRGYGKIGYVQDLPTDLGRNPDYLASKNFVSFATEQGWYDPKSGKPFNVIDVYTRPNQTPPETGIDAQKILATLKAAAPKVDAELLMQLLHQHGRDSSGYGQVADLRADVNSDLRTLWVAPGPPVTAPFVPWRIGVESVPPEYGWHRYLTYGEADLQNINHQQQGIESTRYANRAVKRLLYLVDEHRDAFLPEVASSLEEFDKREIDAEAGITKTAQVLFAAHEDALARRYLTERAHASAAAGLQLIETLADSIEVRTKLFYGIRLPGELPHGPRQAESCPYWLSNCN